MAEQEGRRVSQAAASDEQLADAAWKDTLSTLTLGTAHDFNNVLTGVLSVSDMVLSQLEPAHPFYEALDLIKKNAVRASQLVQGLVEFHYAKPRGPDYQDLNAFLSQTVELLANTVSRRLQVRLELAAEPLPVYIDPILLRRVVASLAVPQMEGPRQVRKVTWRTALCDQPPSATPLAGTWPAMPAACLSIGEVTAEVSAESWQQSPEGSRSLILGRALAESHGGAIALSLEEGSRFFQIWLHRSDFTELERKYGTGSS